MNGNPSDSSIEVTSRQLLDELIEIKDRVGALENVAGIANQDILVKYFRGVLSTDQRRLIMSACRDPLSRESLIEKFGFKSRQALDHHLKPLREGLIHETHKGGVTLFEWSLLFKRLPKAKRDALLSASGNEKK